MRLAVLLLPFAAAAPLADGQHALSAKSEAEDINMVYIKIPKTGSSTTGAIARRFAARRGLTGFADEEFMEKGEPGVWANHNKMDEIEEDVDKLKKPTFFWSVIREPVSRCFSMFYHIQIDHNVYPDGPPFMQAGLDTKKAIDPKNKDAVAAKIHYMKQRCANYQWKYLARSNHTTVDDVWNYYDLLGAAPERLDESAIMMIDRYNKRGFNSDLLDALYVDSKSEESLKEREPDRYIPHIAFEDEPQEVQDYANGEFKDDSALDFELFRRANEMIDQFLADSKNKEHIERFKKAQENVTDACGKEEYCEDGHIDKCEGCIWKDAGCGYECLDKYAGVTTDWTEIATAEEEKIAKRKARRAAKGDDDGDSVDLYEGDDDKNAWLGLNDKKQFKQFGR